MRSEEQEIACFPERVQGTGYREQGTGIVWEPTDKESVGAAMRRPPERPDCHVIPAGAGIPLNVTGVFASGLSLL